MLQMDAVEARVIGSLMGFLVEYVDIVLEDTDATEN
jgi:hypothetical protein